MFKQVQTYIWMIEFDSEACTLISNYCWCRWAIGTEEQHYSRKRITNTYQNAISIQFINCVRSSWINGFARRRFTWCRHDMETIAALLTLCEGNPPVTGAFPSQRVSHAELRCFLYRSLYKMLEKQSSCRGFETALSSCDVTVNKSHAFKLFCKHKQLVVETGDSVVTSDTFSQLRLGVRCNQGLNDGWTQ